MWEMHVANVVLSLIFLYVLYHVVRAAVRDGVRAANRPETKHEGRGRVPDEGPST